MPGSRRTSQRTDRWWTFAAPGYDRTVALVGWHRWLGELVAGVDGGVVLEVGCGPAFLARSLRSRGVDYVGLDRNPAMLHRARRGTHGWGPGRSRLVRGDCTELPFRTGSFDVVVAAGVLGLLRAPQRQAALRELARVSRGEVRLLEPIARGAAGTHRLRTRLLAFAPDGQIALAELVDAGLRPELVGPARLAGVYSQVRGTPLGKRPDR
ncbi:MAG TPA: class I SAM-dependent methyltransferase [Actinomycetes bacterium]